jgi:rhodanese-related sulfurtransferase
MPVKNQKPKECAALLEQGWTILDVRTVEEFEAGHPAGAFNVPVMNRGPAGMTPNPEFVAVVAARFHKTTKLVLNCGSGGRSMRGCEALAAAGFGDLVNMEAGFGGVRDPSGAIEPGWQACGLPTANGRPAGKTYAELRLSAGPR